MSEHQPWESSWQSWLETPHENPHNSTTTHDQSIQQPQSAILTTSSQPFESSESSQPQSAESPHHPSAHQLQPLISPLPQLAIDNLNVYRRRRTGEQIEHGTQPHVQETKPNPSSCENNTGMDSLASVEFMVPSVDDSNKSIAERKGVRSCTTHPIAKYVSYDSLSSSYRAFVSSLDNLHVPNNIQEALGHPEWKRAVHEEINALEKNDTWVITDLPAGKRPVGCKWIFTVKYKADGSVERLKARLVAKGFTQSYGIDYLETFAPVAKLNTIRILLSLAVNLDWYLYQLDIENAFLNGDLEEEVFMEVPQGLDLNLTGNKVCKLKKSLYGLKQSPRAWFDRFTKAVVRLGNDEEELQKLKKQLAQEFEVKDLGNLKYFLGMEVARSRKGIVVSQRKYTLDLLKETGFAVSAVSQFMHNPTEQHMDAVFRILKYLKMTPGKGLFFKKSEYRNIEIYSDADWAGDVTNRRSTSAYCSYVWGNLVTWRSKKQSVVARSSAEAEFRALANGICEGIWIKRVLKELGVCSPSSILMRCDNQAAISIAKNPVHHDRTKHVEIDRHFISEKVTSGSVELKYIPTRQQIADILTKALPRPNFEDLSNKLGLYDIHTPA
ncbi:protein kinase domain-containing protein [Citrus sinensis]|uniref:Protein kinase domain-containing protein n=1 Tax=Citrus sinensis TaxID=2711 RepID=A0ACB8ISR9_CITSI|nr:protein kinase domain-containing protein [Citrus sinensis]